MSVTMAWWLAAGVAVVLELATGTFYLLMFALGLAAAAIAAHLGTGLPAQLMVAAVVGGGAVALWHAWRGRRVQGLPTAANPDVNLDIGQRVQVQTWSDTGTTQVQYRGATWTARYDGPDQPRAGEHVIRAVVGSELRLGR